MPRRRGVVPPKSNGSPVQWAPLVDVSVSNVILSRQGAPTFVTNGRYLSRFINTHCIKWCFSFILIYKQSSCLILVKLCAEALREAPLYCGLVIGQSIRIESNTLVESYWLCQCSCSKCRLMGFKGIISSSGCQHFIAHATARILRIFFWCGGCAWVDMDTRGFISY